MKPILFAAFLLLPLSLTVAQQGPAMRKHAAHGRAARTEARQTDSASARTGTTGTGSAAAASGRGFVDANGDGINDNAPGCSTGNEQKRCRMRGRDAFIDADGDGINDNRCSGLGPKLRGRRSTGIAK